MGRCLHRQLSASGVFADLIIDTSSGPFGGLAPFGESNVEVRGQTFTVTGPETQLDGFSFLYEARLDLAPDFIDSAAYVIAWDGSEAVGPALFVGAPVSSTNNGGDGGFEFFTFNTGGAPLVADIEYVAFLSQSQFLDGLAPDQADRGASVASARKLRQQIDARSDQRPDGCDQIEDEHPEQVSLSGRMPLLASVRSGWSFRRLVERNIDDVARILQTRFRPQPCVRLGA